MSIILYTDGGSRNNPGISGIGAVVYDGAKKVGEISHYLGVRTNNWAEYEAVILGLEEVRRQGFSGKDVEVRLDSKLVAEQLSRNWKIKEESLRLQAERAWLLFPLFKSVRFTYIPREKNKEADALANLAMDRGH
ncbi:MAG: ribonuclease HI family protein [Patescibacteria group bacterium]